MFTKIRHIPNAHKLATDPNDPDGQWLAEAVERGYDISEVNACYVPTDDIFPEGSHTLTLLPEDVHLAQYIGGRLFIEDVQAFADGNGNIWVATTNLG